MKDIFFTILLGKNASTAERIQRVLSHLLRLLILIGTCAALIQGKWIILFVGTLAFIATLFPAILARNYDLYLPTEFEFFLTVFIYAAIFLGEVKSFYAIFWWWDIALHALSGLALGSVGFLILYTLHREGRLSASPLTISFFTFCFALALGALWEMFEFVMDSLFGLNMQKSGLRDTMWDLIVDAGGAGTLAIFSYVYIKKETREGVFDRMIRRIDERRRQGRS